MGDETQKRRMKTVEDSKVEVTYVVRPAHLNGAGRLLGGQLMQWIDAIAALVARKHAQTGVVTAAVDNLKFIRGAYQNDLVVLIGRLVYVGHTSMEVRVDTYLEDEEGIRKPINRAYLIEVAMDQDGKTVTVPGLTLSTESERAEWEAALKRREIRKQARQEGF